MPDPDMFFSEAGLDRQKTQRALETALAGCDDGELFLEYNQSESLSFDDGKLKNGSFDTRQGFGLRAVCGETAAYAHASELSEEALNRAVASVTSVRGGYSGTMSSAPARTNRKLYLPDNPIDGMPFAAKVALLQDVDSYTRAMDSKVIQVTVSLQGIWQNVEIVRADGFSVSDVRPLVRFNVTVITDNGKTRGTGSYGIGGRQTYDEFLSSQSWKSAADEALRQSLVSLEAEPAPAGEMDVVLGPGWPGVLLHEAVGHGLEGDFNRKKTGAFSGLMGERIAAPGVTVVDDGTISARRGSLSVDDEGTPTNCTTLIEDGILVGYMQDRLNARLMNVTPTGNGRRQSFAHSPMPRMTNTYMRSGDKTPEEILASVDNGLYAVSFGGGSVDITSGNFVFTCTEAYKVENGKVGAPVKGATLIGNGADAMMRVSMVGNDMELDPGIGTCGKAGQGVPVGVGQPTVRLDKITVGGTAAG